MIEVNWTLILAALIAAVPPTIASIASVIVAIRALTKIEQVHVATNSMKDALVVAAKKEGHAAGVADEKAVRA